MKLQQLICFWYFSFVQFSSEWFIRAQDSLYTFFPLFHFHLHQGHSAALPNSSSHTHGFLFFFVLSTLSLVGKSGRFTRVRLPQLQEQHYPFLTVCTVFSCVQTTVWLPMLVIFNVHMDVNACDCTQGLYTHCKRVCLHWKLNRGGESLPALGNQICLNNVQVWCSTNWPTSLPAFRPLLRD